MAKFKVQRIRTYVTTVEAPSNHAAFDDAHYLSLRHWELTSDRIAPEVIGTDGAIQRLQPPPEDGGQ